MDDIKNTLLLVNGNIDSTDEYSRTQIGDQSGNFWINKNDHVEYSDDIRRHDMSTYHKSIKLNNNSKLELVDPKHLFNFNNREFSVDAWVKFDETEYNTEKNHVVIAKWNENNNPMDSKLFKFYYKHLPNKSESSTIDILVSSNTTGFTFNGIEDENFTFSNTDVYNLLFDVSMWSYEYDGEKTIQPTGLPNNFTISTTVDDTTLGSNEQINSDETEVDVVGQWANVLVGEPVSSTTQTDDDDYLSDQDDVVESATQTQSEITEDKYGILSNYIKEISGGIQLDFTDAEPSDLNFKLVFTHTYQEEDGQDASPISGIPVFGISSNTNNKLTSDYDEYLNNFNTPTTQSVTSTDPTSEPLALTDWITNNLSLHDEYSEYVKLNENSNADVLTYSEWVSSTNYAESPTETITYNEDIPISASDTLNLVEISNEATINLNVFDNKNADGKLVFEFNGMKGYKSEYRTLKLSKSFIHNEVEYDKNEYFEPILFSEITIQNLEKIPSDVKDELSDTKSKIWKSDSGVIIYPLFKDFSEFYRVKGDIGSSPPRNVSSTTETNDSIPTQTTTQEENIGLVEYENYLNSNVNRTFKFIPVESYDDITSEFTFRVNSEDQVEYKELTDIVVSGHTHELEVGNLIDGEWHHIYYASEAAEPSDMDSFNEKVTFGIDGELFPRNLNYFEEDYPYIQFRKNVTKKIKLTSIQPFFEAADLKVPYESLLAVNIVSIGHDNSQNGNNLIGTIDSVRVNEFATFESPTEYLDFYDNNETPSCFLFLDGINSYCIFDENTKYDLSASPTSPGVSILPVVRYTENPTTPFEALKSEMGSLAYLKRILGYDFTQKSEEEISNFLKEWRWKLKFISPTSDLKNTQELEGMYQEYVDTFFTGEALDDTEQ